MKIKIPFMLFACFYLSHIINGQSNEELIQQLDKRIPELMTKMKVPGMALAIYDEGQLIHHRGYGLKNIEDGSPVTVHTGFNIGSISKLFTAFGVMLLAQDGQIDLNAPVNKYLSRWKFPPSAFDESLVTIASLLNHTGGISVHGYPGFIDKKGLPNLEASLDGNNGPQKANEAVAIIATPQTEFKYSGGGFTILQLMIEEVSGLAFQEFMKKRIFAPLNMKHSSFDINDSILSNTANPYDKNGQPLPLEYFTAQGAAGLHTTIADFVLFAEEILNEHQLLPSKGIDQMIHPTQVSGEIYGLGFRTMTMGPMKLTGHAGSNTGWEAAFFIDFRNKSGLIMMTNGDEGDKVLKATLRSWGQMKYSN